ncbi:MAG: hypothetical protein MSH35_05370 [Lactobacillus amylovorus]|uniref:hypothetical protein n=1 Tax=Lactobacillus sp. OTU4228 TaxID=1572760 RepID=UPI000695FEBA|nr:hypothetical protein [Lactobacillus sp. OTU4228]MCI7336146.1 hypothetical protein [Lactobacillus amylovorus]MDD7407397.1 hypothetical protein [Lactobacillus amylovorus]MDY4730787.1 hypothetical protein [Lactobacillus amylovorus]
MLNLFVKATTIRVEEGVFYDKEAESVLEDKNLTDSEISQELIDKDNPIENVKPSEIDFLRKKPDLATQIDGDLAGLSKEAKEEAVVTAAK